MVGLSLPPLSLSLSITEFFLLLFETRSLLSSDCSKIHCVAQAGLRLEFLSMLNIEVAGHHCSRETSLLPVHPTASRVRVKFFLGAESPHRTLDLRMWEIV